MAESARQLGTLAPAVASIFDRLASDPAMSAISADPTVDWLTDVDTDAIALFTAHATAWVNAIIDSDKAARKAKRRNGFVSMFSSKKDS